MISPPHRLILHALPRAVAYSLAFVVAAYLLADTIGLLVEHAPYVGTLLVGWMLGVLTIAAIKEHDYRRRTRSLAVLGRDVPVARAVLRERMPAGPAVPTKYRRWLNSKGHVRYSNDQH